MRKVLLTGWESENWWHSHPNYLSVSTSNFSEYKNALRLIVRLAWGALERLLLSEYSPHLLSAFFFGFSAFSIPCDNSVLLHPKCCRIYYIFKFDTPFRRLSRLKNHGKRTLENPQSIDMTGFVRVVAIILYGHTFTSNLLSNGAAPKDVQELLGHADVSTTMNIYAHATRKAKRSSARLLDKVVGGG